MILGAAAALAFFVVLGLIVQDGPPPAIDEWAFDAVDPLRGQAGLDVVRVLTDLGSLPVAALLVGLTAAFSRQHALPLVAALIALFVLVHVGKDFFDRPRPATRFYEPGGHSYPSGHSAYATVWLAAALIIGKRGLILGGACVMLAIGLSRLYLHVHYLTDVLGGFALGAAVFLPVLARR